MMGSPQPWYVEMRAQAHAVLRLTARSGLQVTLRPSADGVDFLLTLAADGEVSGRHVGVVVKPRVSESEVPRLTPRSVRRERSQFADAVFPVCMVSFSPVGEQGYFRWIIEPSVESGVAVLGYAARTHFEPLTNDVVDRLVHDVSAWYDARRDGASARSRGARTAGER
jgi:hypothetical protein